MQKRKLLLFIVLLIIQILSMNVFADHAVPNLNIDGSITIHMNNGDKPLKGGSLTFYQVGRIKESNGNYSFTLTDEFSASELELKTSNQLN